MKATETKSCYIGPAISPEQYIAEHFFLYLAKGTINGYDGTKHYTLRSGEYCLARKNRLGRYNKQKEDNEFEKVILIFDEPFLKNFQEKHKIRPAKFNASDTFIRLQKNEFIPGYIGSLMPYYNSGGKLDETFADIKREELLLILLKVQAELSSVFFDFGSPGKINDSSNKRTN